MMTSALSKPTTAAFSGKQHWKAMSNSAFASGALQNMASELKSQALSGSRQGRPRTYTISPFDGRIQGWDLVTGSALIFTALVAPFEVAFMPPPPSAADALFLLNRLIDCIFFADMVLQFFVRSISDLEPPPLAMNAGRYLRGWFWLDAIALFPSCVFDVLPLVLKQDSDGKSPLTLLRILRAVFHQLLLQYLRD